MNIKQIIYLTTLLLIIQPYSTMSTAGEILFSSTETKVSLIELYTSEGCSSCPPADKWLNKFQDDNALWTKVVPLAFHVDYWDYLGWKDKFADSRFADRQYRYQQLNHVRAVYTPGVMKNGREWRGWRWWQSAYAENESNPGKLSAILKGKSLAVTFNDLSNSKATYVLNIALLGKDIQSQVTAGENDGENFEHDFVVLNLRQHKSNESVKNTWQITDPLNASTDEKIHAIAIWVNQVNDPTPIQATGTWLYR